MRAASPVPSVVPKILFGTTLGTGLARGSKILFGGAPVLVPVSPAPSVVKAKFFFGYPSGRLGCRVPTPPSIAANNRRGQSALRRMQRSRRALFTASRLLPSRESRCLCSVASPRAAYDAAVAAGDLVEACSPRCSPLLPARCRSSPRAH